jgi:CRISPR/Cas system-associated exonuclease Cas4 (RecB family)
MENKNIKEYHQSEIQTYLTCGKQYEFRYIMGIKTPPKAALTVGSSVDAGVTRNLAQKIETQKDLSVDEVLDVYSTDFDIRADETEWGEDDRGQQKDVGAKLIKLHHETFAPKIDPATVQEKFIIETDAGFNVGGTIDLTEKNGIIADTKTAKSKYDDDAVFRALQPAMYDFAYEALNGKKAKAFRYDVLIKPTKTLPARAQQIEAQVTIDDRAWLFETIHAVDKGIKAGVALPAPEKSWVCSPEWCGYYSQCKGKNRGVR